MDEDFDRSVDLRRARQRTKPSSAGDRTPFFTGRVGCSLVSLAAMAVVMAIAATGLLDQSLSWIQATIGGRRSSSDVMMLSNCRQLVAALKLYAADHNESYPDSLYDLSPEILTAAELNRLLTEGRAPDSASDSAWLLVPHLTTSAGTNDILIISARPTGKGRHIAGLNDGSVIPVSVQVAVEYLQRTGL